MRKKSFIIKFVFVLLSVAPLVAFSQTSKTFSINESPLPEPTGPVMDYAGVLDSATKERLAKRILEFRDQTTPSIELGVAIVKTTEGRPIFDYSLAVARGWGIGSQEDDNPGALLFIAINDRKYFTQVSNDLEDELPDGVVGSLQRQYLVPQFKRGNYGKGIEDTINAYIRTINAKTHGTLEQTDLTNDKPQTEYETDDSGGFEELCGVGACVVIVFIIVLVAIFSSDNDDDQSRGNRGGGGSSAGAEVALSILGGLISGAIDSGGGSSSSSWGGSSGGGFGGFGGGGSFGGGGAGGSW